MKKYKFWKDNRTDQEFELTIDEIKPKYLDFLKFKGIAWAEYYGHQTVIAFIGDKQGLNSVTDKEIYTELQEELQELRWEYYDSFKKTE